MTWQVEVGDCREVLAGLPDNSFEAVVSDPPYGISFMGNSDWDGQVPGVEFWSEFLRVAKPGAHLLAFGGTRTWHRMAVAIEDAGWEIRDTMMWLYGSGFPKSHNIGKAIDRRRDDRAEVLRVTAWIREARDEAGIGNRDIDAAFGFAGMAGHWTSGKSQPAVPTLEQIPILLKTLGDPEVPEDIGRLLWTLNGRKGQPGENWAKREVVGKSAHKPGIGNGAAGHYTVGGTLAAHVDITAPATDLARQWEGWGTALKPAWEPIIVARKKPEGTVAGNVERWGCGGLNVDGCRVGGVPGDGRWGKGVTRPDRSPFTSGEAEYVASVPNPSGRWPANLILDPEAGAMLDEQAGERGASGKASGPTLTGKSTSESRGQFNGVDDTPFYGDIGGPSRFFYCPKASRADRNSGDSENKHPTVKPTDLMRYLCRLVTPPGGTVLDPFTGSGSTGKAAVLEGFNFFGCELSPEYADIARARIGHEANEPSSLWGVA